MHFIASMGDAYWKLQLWSSLPSLLVALHSKLFLCGLAGQSHHPRWGGLPGDAAAPESSWPALLLATSVNKQANKKSNSLIVTLGYWIVPFQESQSQHILPEQ